MQEVFVVQHVHAIDSDREDVKMVGVYSTEATAKAAADRLELQPGFRDSANAFDISRYEIDKDHWTEGYISWAEALSDGLNPAQDRQ